MVFADGGTASGSFDLSSANSMLNVDVTTTGSTNAVLPDFNYRSGRVASVTNPVHRYIPDSGEFYAHRGLALGVVPDLRFAQSGDVVPLHTGCSYECNNCGVVRWIISGSLVANSVPTGTDTDGDGHGDSTDPDDDNDNVLDGDDPFPLIPDTTPPTLGPTVTPNPVLLGGSATATPNARTPPVSPPRAAGRATPARLEPTA